MPYWWINKVTVVQNSGSETLRTEKLFCKTNILTNSYLERKYILKLLYCAFFFNAGHRELHDKNFGIFKWNLGDY
jgi:hypothetical protein